MIIEVPGKGKGKAHEERIDLNYQKQQEVECKDTGTSEATKIIKKNKISRRKKQSDWGEIDQGNAAINTVQTHSTTQEKGE